MLLHASPSGIATTRSTPPQRTSPADLSPLARRAPSHYPCCFCPRRGGRRDANIVTRASSELLPPATEPTTLPERLQQLLIDFGVDKQEKVAFLEGNFGPVSRELFVEGLDVVEGALPAELDGVYIRNGPNPLFKPYNKHHWFEGDGMVHAVRIKDGKANYCNSYVNTKKLGLERQVGRPIWAKFGDQEGLAGAAIAMLDIVKIQMGILDISAGNGTANTSLAYHAGRLLALHEGDMPYQLYISPEGRVSTVKRLGLGERWSAPTDNFTAHPKLDGKTGDLHFFSYHAMTPQIKLGKLNSRGDLCYDLKVDMPQPSMIHDMAITRSSKIIFHFPLSFDPAAMVAQNSLPLVFKAEQASRIGLAPHDATSQDQVQWFSLPSFMSFHIVNTWDEGPGGRFVTIYLIALRRIDLDASSFSDDYASRMHEVTLDRKKGTAHMRKVTSIIGDFPVVHPLMQGQRTKHAWTAITDPEDSMGRTVGIAKFDLISRANQDACVAQVRFPPGYFGGEATYVPRDTNDPSVACDGEDDGYLVCYVHHDEASTTYMMVFDAKTMSDTPVAKVKLPQRVPYGFHGMFLNQDQLMQLKAV